MIRLTLVLATLLALAPRSAHAHKASDSFLSLSPSSAQTLRGHWDVGLDDLAYALALDTGDGALTWGQLRGSEAAIAGLLEAGLRFEVERSACAVQTRDLLLVALSDGPYARVPFDVRCPGLGEVRLRASLLGQVDRDHKVLLRFGEGEQAVSQVLSSAHATLSLPLRVESVETPLLRAFASQIGRGFMHILEGTDHLAFLLVLLLPALFAHARAQVNESLGWSATLRAIVKVVTAFTFAHSLTLSLAALGLVRTSADVIEPAIAASVALAALSNLFPRLGQDGFMLAFALGLLHGFGFSSALADAGLSGGALLAALLGFNLGVELGQLSLVALFVPCALWLRRARWCRLYALPCGSAAVLALALFWVFERLQTG